MHSGRTRCKDYVGDVGGVDVAGDADDVVDDHSHDDVDDEDD